jgi:hypothetical protein
MLELERRAQRITVGKIWKPGDQEEKNFRIFLSWIPGFQIRPVFFPLCTFVTFV